MHDRNRVWNPTNKTIEARTKEEAENKAAILVHEYHLNNMYYKVEYDM